MILDLLERALRTVWLASRAARRRARVWWARLRWTIDRGLDHW